jgi:hypothetical protein
MVSDGEVVDVCVVLGEAGAKSTLASTWGAYNIDDDWFGRLLVWGRLACLV